MTEEVVIYSRKMGKSVVALYFLRRFVMDKVGSDGLPRIPVRLWTTIGHSAAALEFVGVEWHETGEVETMR